MFGPPTHGGASAANGLGDSQVGEEVQQLLIA